MHVFTLGFVTTLIFGVASRFFTIFEGADIHHPRLMDATFAFVTVNVVLRVAFSFSISEICERALGASGGIGFIGIYLFAIVAFQAMIESARTSYSKRAAEFGQIRILCGSERTSVSSVELDSNHVSPGENQTSDAVILN